MASQLQTPKRRVPAWPCFAAIALAVAVSFREAPFLGFVDYDDPVAVLNPVLRGGFSWESLRFAFTEAPINLWHPLTFLTHLVDFELYGNWAGGHHLGNVLIHLASCLLLFGWLRRHTGEVGLSLAVTLIFAIHPLRVESVIWVTERKDVLSLFFYLLTIWFYSTWATTTGPARRRAYILSLAAAVLGILSKPSLMTLPLVLLIVDLWPLGRLRWEDRTNWPLLRQRIVEKIPFAILALVAAVVAWSTWSGNQFIGEPPNLPLALRAGFASLAYITYLQRTLLPIDLVPFRSYPMFLAGSAHILAFIAMGMTMVLAFLRLPKFPWFAAGWLWFVVAILPASGLITISDHFAPDRYTYLAHIGLWIAVVWGLATWGRKRRIPPVVGWMALVLVLIPCSILTNRQSLVWRDPETLWRHTLAARGTNYVAHNQLGLFLLHAGRFDEGVAELQKAMAANPGFPLPIANLARARANQGNLDEAIRLMREAGPDLPMREAFREELLARSIAAGRRDLAAGLWEDLLAEAPRDPLKRLAAGEFAYQNGDLPAAMTHYRAALELDPENAAAALNLGALLIKRGSLDEAIPMIERSIAHAPDAGAAADAHRTLAQAHLLKREWAPAIASYERGFALAPDRDLLRNELAQLLLDVPKSSLRNPERALVLAEPFGSSPADKANPRYLRTLARALQANDRLDEAKAVASSGLEAVANLSAKEPLEKPWTKEELASLAKAFREIAGVPVP
jgi:tetratricopeptide (TPR) repeat protein